METRDRKQGAVVRRIRPEGIVPLELWDLRVGDGILWDWAARDDFGGVLRRALGMLHAGGGATRSEGPVPPCVRGFSGVYLTGGGAARLAPGFEGAPWPVWFGSEGAHAAEPGGRALLAGQGYDGWVVDLGQTSLKVFAGGRRWAFPRDYEVLPVRRDDRVPLDDQRESLRRFIGDALRRCLEEGAPGPDAIVLALPSRLDDRGVPGGSSYHGMGGDDRLVSDACLRAGLPPLTVFVLNDAELAAMTARLDRRRQGRTLVLTIGFGVGAALIES